MLADSLKRGSGQPGAGPLPRCRLTVNACRTPQGETPYGVPGWLSTLTFASLVSLAGGAAAEGDHGPVDLAD